MFLRDSPELCLRIKRSKSKNATNTNLVSDSDSASAVTEKVENQATNKKRKKATSQRKHKRKVAPKTEVSTQKSLQVNEEDNDAVSTELKAKAIPKIDSPVTTATITEDRNIEISHNNIKSVDGYTQWLAALSQNATHKTNIIKPQLPIDNRVSILNHLLAQQQPSLSNLYTPVSLLQLQQNRGQLLGNLGLPTQPMLPNTGHLLNPLSHTALNASNIDFVKSLLNANYAKSREGI